MIRYTTTLISFVSTSSVVAGTYGNVTLSGNGVAEWPEPEEEPEEPAEESEEASAAEDSVPVSEATAESSEPASIEETASAQDSSEAETAQGEAPASKLPAGAIAGIAAVLVAGCGAAIGISRGRKKK